jgi:CRP-like cAMP-binding protein
VLGQTRRRGGGPRIVTMRANMPSRVLTIADAALEAVAADEPGLWRAVNELVHAQLEETTRLAARLLVQGPAARIAARLLQFSQDDRVTVSQSDLAEMTGLSRKSVNGHLAAFARAGTIARGYRAITIVDRGALEDVAMR